MGPVRAGPGGSPGAGGLTRDGRIGGSAATCLGKMPAHGKPTTQSVILSNAAERFWVKIPKIVGRTGEGVPGQGYTVRSTQYGEQSKCWRQGPRPPSAAHRGQSG